MAIDAKTKRALKSALNQTRDYSEIAQILNQDQVKTPNGQEWTAALVSYHLVNNVGIRMIKKHRKKKPDVAAVKAPAVEIPALDTAEESFYSTTDLLLTLNIILSVVQLCFIIGLILTIS